MVLTPIPLVIIPASVCFYLQLLVYGLVYFCYFPIPFWLEGFRLYPPLAETHYLSICFTGLLYVLPVLLQMRRQSSALLYVLFASAFCLAIHIYHSYLPIPRNNAEELILRVILYGSSDIMTFRIPPLTISDAGNSKFSKVCPLRLADLV